MIIESGIIVAGGLLLTFFKCSWSARQAMLSNPLFMDLVVFAFLTAIHWGTFSGVMTASMGALITSGLISTGRWLYGYTIDKQYYPGVFDVSEEIKKDMK